MGFLGLNKLTKPVEYQFKKLRPMLPILAVIGLGLIVAASADVATPIRIGLVLVGLGVWGLCAYVYKRG